MNGPKKRLRTYNKCFLVSLLRNESSEQWNENVIEHWTLDIILVGAAYSK